MARIESYTPGSFCWAELATTDAAAAKQFYGEMFGWTAVDMPMPEGVYTLFQADGNDAAAVYTRGPGVPVHWGVYFSVASADETAARIGPSGGKLIAGPFDAHDAGRMAVAQDPQGAVFSVWQAKRHIGATHGGPLGMVVWPELATTDPAGAAGFYTRLFGWKTKPEAGVAEAPYTEWLNGGSRYPARVRWRPACVVWRPPRIALASPHVPSPACRQPSAFRLARWRPLQASHFPRAPPAGLSPALSRCLAARRHAPRRLRRPCPPAVPGMVRHRRLPPRRLASPRP